MFKSRNQQIVVGVWLAQQTHRRFAVGGDFHVVRGLQHPRQQPAEYSPHRRPAGFDCRWRGRCRLGLAVPLALEPVIQIPLAKAPLPAHANGRNASGLDESIDRSQVDIEVFEDLLGGQKGVVGRKVEGHGLSSSRSFHCTPPARARRSKPYLLKDLERRPRRLAGARPGARRMIGETTVRRPPPSY